MLLFFVGGWLVWELTPLQEWIGTGKSWWDQIGAWTSGVGDLIGKIKT